MPFVPSGFLLRMAVVAVRSFRGSFGTLWWRFRLGHCLSRGQSSWVMGLSRERLEEQTEIETEGDRTERN